MDEKLNSKLEKRRQDNILRYLSISEGNIDFFSNDYLGFARLVEKENLKFEKSGATGSRLLSGNSEEAQQTEKALAEFFDSEAALVFNSGYSANLGLMSSVLQRGDTILYDEFSHASIRDGIRLSYANSISFKHNDLLDLEKKLAKAEGVIYVVVESLYSMDGDMAPLGGITELTRKYNAYLIVDEAHAVGVFGKDGKGIIHGREIVENVFARVITFGKAYGFHGAAILGSKELINFLVNFSRPFIYTTALPPYEYSKIATRIKRNDIRERQVKLHKNIQYFRSNLNMELPSEINSPIQVLQFESKERVIEIAQKLTKAGIYTKPVFAPTVPEGKERIRLCFHSFNTFSEIDLLLNSF